MFSDTLTFLTLPMNQFLSPILDFIFGPSPPILPQPKLDIYPLFGPMAMCFFSKTHAPFTIVLNKMIELNEPRTLDDGRYSITLIIYPILTLK